MQHSFVRTMLLGGTGSFSSYSLKGRACEIVGFKLTLTDCR